MDLSPNKNVVLGVSWFTPEEWKKIKSISVDSEKLDDTYDEWMKNAENAISMFTEHGLQVRKINVNALEFVQWCTENGKMLDGGARSEFVAGKVREQDQRSLEDRA